MIKKIYKMTMLLIVCLGIGLHDLQAQTTQPAESDGVVVVPHRPTVSELRVRGRIQGQHAFSGGDNSHAVDAGEYSSFEIRRVRLGVQGRIFDNWSFLTEVNAVELDAATVSYMAAPQASVTFGKAKPRFGHEQNTSSGSILTFERTRLDGHLNGGKPIGLRMHGVMDIFTYYLGVYNGQSVSIGRMSSGSDSYLYNASAGLNLGSLIGDGVAVDFRADYLHTGDDTGYYDFEDALAFSGRFAASGFDLRTEYMTGNRHDGGNISGFYLLPSYFIVPGTFQAVVRYENVTADGGIGLGHNRYADRVPGLFGGGNNYDAIYAGVNYFIHGDNLKLMLGVELAGNSDETMDMEGRAATVFTGFRMQF